MSAPRPVTGTVESALELRPLTPAEAALVPGLWNDAWEAVPGAARRYPLSAALWRERLASRHHDPTLLIGAFAPLAADTPGRARELVGVAYGKVPRSPWQPQNVGWVGLLAVAAARQGRGVGTRLTAQLLSLLDARGCTTVRFGADADHLLPGPPQESGPAAWRLLRRFGASFAAAEHDLHLDLRPQLPERPLPPGWRLRADDGDGALAFVNRAFPGRWAEELADYLAGGATVITLERLAGGGDAGPAGAQGFCAVFPGGESVTSPGLIWAPALRREVEPTAGQGGVRLAGMGPLGIAPEVRGEGAGLALVRGAADYLRAAGATDAVINWTSLTTFYGRLGARLWRTYQRAEAPMPARSLLAARMAGER